MTPVASSVNPRVTGQPAEWRSEKVQPWHRDRLAIIYVRQSTAQQVLAHQESTRLQYGLTERAHLLGWAATRIVVIDDDLGKSGASSAGRLGFQRLVSEVSLDHVGLILGVEMSRLARSNTDWHQLLELCALFRTLIADLDGVYDPSQYNDRLLLGLKGTMSEAELHVLKQRMYAGRLNKARRGDLVFALPSGYVWQEPGVIGFDPDAQVQQVVRLIFRKFAELGTLGSVLRYLAQHEIQLGIRVREGPGKGQLEWRRPNRMTLQTLLKHPLYAGAYAYGRRQQDPRRQRPAQPRTGRVVQAPADWLAFVPDHAPAYISWAQYEANQAQLQANQARATARGAVRAGAALLAGLVSCAHCGGRLTVHYAGPHGHYTYECTRRHNNYGEPRCQHVPGPCLDAFVSQQVLAALAPAALDLSLSAAARVEHERADLQQLWQQRRERARYEAERAARQYQAVEPENRLVARTLERQWEERLATQQHLEEEYQRLLQRQPRLVTAEERERIRQLATDIPALWSAPTTTAADRKALIRPLVERIIVAAHGRSEQVQVTIVWAGGAETRGSLARPVARLATLSYYPQLCARVQALVETGHSSAAIAEQLEAEGYRPAKRSTRFTAQSVAALRRHLGLTTHPPRPASRTTLGPDEWWRTDLARTLGMPRSTLENWIRAGVVTARQQETPPHRWVIWADASERERLQQRHRRSLSEAAHQQWVALPQAVP